MFRMYGSIAKVDPRDDGTLVVSGCASSEAVDSQGEVITADAMRQALPAYLVFPAVREMHQQQAAGTALTVEVGEDGRTSIEALIVDPVAVAKVRAGVYRGFSIGGSVKQRSRTNPRVIEALTLTEISLVDRPANGEATIALWKAEAGEAPGGPPNWPNGERTEAQVEVEATSAPPTVEEPAHRCSVCSTGMVCPECSRGVAEVERMAKLAGTVTGLVDGLEKAHRERDEAVAKVARLVGERDDLAKRLADVQVELARRPKGSLKAVPVSKADDTGMGVPEAAEPEDALAAIRKAHQRPVPMRVRGAE